MGLQAESAGVMMYSMSKQITWYEELSWIGEYRFPLQRRKQSYTALMTEWVHDYCTHIDACKSLDDETKRRIKTFANSLVECHTRYLNSQFADAYTLFNQSMNDVQGSLLSVDFGMQDGFTNEGVGHYFRIRKGDKTRSYLEMLHIPLSSRRYATTGRFSAPGMPCSYLASTVEICWYECEMPRIFQLAEYKVKGATEDKKKLLRLDINPLFVKHDLPLLYRRNDISDDQMKCFAEQLFFILPLLAMCSVTARKNDGDFTEEYVIPQMLMAWLRSNSTFIGVRYYSDSSNALVRNNRGHNVAIPVRDENNAGYSSEICSLFEFSEDAKSKTVDMANVLQRKFSKEIAKLELFLEEVTYEKQHFNSLDPTLSSATVAVYSDYCSICESLLSLLSDYSDNKEQSCYAIVLTLAEMFNWGNLLKEHVSNQSGMFDERANEYATRFNDEILGLMDSICSFFRLSITWGI